jgi:peptide chain release factor 1
MLHPALRAVLTAEAARHEQLEHALADPDAARDPARLKSLLQEAGRLKKRLERFSDYLRRETSAHEADELARTESDAEMKALARDESARATAEADALGRELESELLGRHKYSDRSIILEVRAGTGGDEASLFAGELVRMYQRYAERHGMRFDEISASRSDVGGTRELIASIEGESVFDALRFESGVHRVQRVPATEAQDRLHTSTATVAVLPEAEDVEVDLKESDLKVDTFRAGGPGGQAVNKTSSAIRVTHLPTGLVVICQDERSQGRNRSKALKTLKSRLFELQQEKQQSARASDRRDQIGSGDRSEKIRTYNFKQDRVTDHRLDENFHNLPAILDGGLDELIAALKRRDLERRLAELEKPPS